jgi:DNA replication protein DnaC
MEAQTKLPVTIGEILKKQFMAVMQTKADMPKDFDEVQLTDDQIEELIYQERLRIYFDAKKVQEKNLNSNEKLEAKRPFTTEELKAFILNNNPNFKVDDTVKDLFELLCLYFSRNKEFESKGEGFSLYKGLAITGLPGCGKTELLSLFQTNKRQSFYLVNINKINQDCKENGIDCFKRYVQEVPGWGHSKEYFYQEQVTWGIDDIGLEEPVNDYGNKAYVFSKIIQERYSNKHLMQYYPLHITTMLTADQIGEKYGTFIRSRLREMFNYIEYKGTDRRK